MNCPFCRSVMDTVALQRTIGGPFEVNVCRHRDGIWFDAGEQFRLMPAATPALLRDMQANRGDRRPQSGTRLPCPRGSAALDTPFDLYGSTQYRYFRCGNHDGVF